MRRILVLGCIGLATAAAALMSEIHKMTVDLGDVLDACRIGQKTGKLRTAQVTSLPIHIPDCKREIRRRFPP
jgi:hypothetical protein